MKHDSTSLTVCPLKPQKGTKKLADEFLQLAFLSGKTKHQILSDTQTHLPVHFLLGSLSLSMCVCVSLSVLLWKRRVTLRKFVTVPGLRAPSQTEKCDKQTGVKQKEPQKHKRMSMRRTARKLSKLGMECKKKQKPAEISVMNNHKRDDLNPKINIIIRIILIIIIIIIAKCLRIS